MIHIADNDVIFKLLYFYTNIRNIRRTATMTTWHKQYLRYFLSFIGSYYYTEEIIFIIGRFWMLLKYFCLVPREPVPPDLSIDGGRAPPGAGGCHQAPLTQTRDIKTGARWRHIPPYAKPYVANLHNLSAGLLEFYKTNIFANVRGHQNRHHKCTKLNILLIKMSSIPANLDFWQLSTIKTFNIQMFFCHLFFKQINRGFLMFKHLL